MISLKNAFKISVERPVGKRRLRIRKTDSIVTVKLFSVSNVRGTLDRFG